MAGKPIKSIRAARGAAIAVWDNGDKGTAITIKPPQYQDSSGNWKDGSIFVTDIPGLIHAMGRAMIFMEEFADNRTSDKTTIDEEKP